MATKKKTKRSRKNESGSSKQVLLIAFLCVLLIAGALYIFDPALFNEVVAKPLQSTTALAPQASASPSADATPPASSPIPIKSDGADTAPAAGGALTAYIIDVSQGDSILLTSPSGKTMLIDAGESDSFEAIDDLLKSQDITKLDVVVATHPHSDHIGGMAKVIKAYEIGAFYISPKAHTTKTYERMLDALEEKNVATYPAYGGADSYIKWDDDVTVRILSPIKGEDYDDLNDFSVILCCTYGNTGIMLTGDAETHAESLALSKLPLGLFNATAIKMGHHGSSTSSSEAFIKAVSPDIALISVGEGNDYGHPHKETLDLLAKLNIPYYRTDECGTIIVGMDGTETTVTKKPAT